MKLMTTKSVGHVNDIRHTDGRLFERSHTYCAQWDESWTGFTPLHKRYLLIGFLTLLSKTYKSPSVFIRMTNALYDDDDSIFRRAMETRDIPNLPEPGWVSYNNTKAMQWLSWEWGFPYPQRIKQRVEEAIIVQCKSHHNETAPAQGTITLTGDVVKIIIEPYDDLGDVRNFGMMAVEQFSRGAIRNMDESVAWQGSQRYEMRFQVDGRPRAALHIMPLHTSDEEARQIDVDTVYRYREADDLAMDGADCDSMVLEA